MFYRIKKKIKEKSAQALPEFALCLPLIMLMIGILITVGQMVYAKEVLQAAAQSYCRAFVTNYTLTGDDVIPAWIRERYGLDELANNIADRRNETAAHNLGKERAKLIMESAALNIMMLPDAETYDYTITSITGEYTNPADGGIQREILTSSGETYEYVEVTVHGAIETLFPVQWNGNELTPNLTFLEAYCAMLIEKP